MHNSWVGEKNHNFFFSQYRKSLFKAKPKLENFPIDPELQIKIQNCCISAKGSYQTL